MAREDRMDRFNPGAIARGDVAIENAELEPEASHRPPFAGRTVEAILVDSVLKGLGEIGLQLDRCDRKAV
jgi:hypothetical protein